MMTARQVAALLGVHENWVYDQAAAGALPSYKIGGTRRFLPDELRSWIAEHRQTSRDQRPTDPGRRRGDSRFAKRTRDPQPRLFDG